MPNPNQISQNRDGYLPENVELEFQQDGTVRWRLLSDAEVKAKRVVPEGGVLAEMKRQASEQAASSGAAERTRQNEEQAKERGERPDLED